MHLSKENKFLLERAGFQFLGAVDLLDFIIEDLKEEEDTASLLRIMHIKKELNTQAQKIATTLKEIRKNER